MANGHGVANAPRKNVASASRRESADRVRSAGSGYASARDQLFDGEKRIALHSPRS